MNISMPIRFLIAITLALAVNSGKAFSQPKNEYPCKHEKKEKPCNNPNDETINGNVDKQHLVLTGNVGRLIIKGRVDGQSLLDLRGLKAKEIIIEDRIDGQSVVLIGTVTGNISIGKKIDGQSAVQVASCHDFRINDESIDGQSLLFISRCHDFTIAKGGISGGKNGISPGKATEVNVSYTGKVTIKDSTNNSRMILKMIK